MLDRSHNGSARGEEPRGKADAVDRASNAPMPRSARLLLFGALLLAMLGALYLIIARGDALLVDLAKLGRIFCF
jgi:hypothetical protein